MLRNGWMNYGHERQQNECGIMKHKWQQDAQRSYGMDGK